LRQGGGLAHERITGSIFEGRTKGVAATCDCPGIIPSVAARARVTGLDTIFIDDSDPSAPGFQVLKRSTHHENYRDPRVAG